MKPDAAPSGWLRSTGPSQALLHPDPGAPLLRPQGVLHSTRSQRQLSLPFLRTEPRSDSPLKPVARG